MAPSLDLDLGPELRTLNFNESLNDTASARIDLDLSHYSTTINVLEDSDLLIDAELDTLENIDFEVRGGDNKVVTLKPRGSTSVLDWVGTLGNDANWEIGLSPQIPIDLRVDIDSGSARLNLDDMILERIDLDGGSGSTRLVLPASPDSYDVRLDCESGSFTVEIADGAMIDAKVDVDSGSFKITFSGDAEADLDIDGDSGSTTIIVPDDAGVRLIIRDSGSGSVTVPGGYTLVSEGGDDDEDTGTWESDDYDDAEYRIEIKFEGGSGSFTLREN
jgi:hypothetical protein